MLSGRFQFTREKIGRNIQYSTKQGRFPFAQSDQSVLKRVLRTGSCYNFPAPGSESLSSSAPVGQSAESSRVVAEKFDLAVKLARTSSFRPARTDIKAIYFQKSLLTKTFHWASTLIPFVKTQFGANNIFKGEWKMSESNKYWRTGEEK